MINVTFQLNGVDFSSKLSTYNVRMLYEYPVVVTTLDGTEHIHQRRRPQLSFSLIPLTEAEIKSLYDCLKTTTVTVYYTDTYTNNNVTATMRVITELSHIFALDSVTGNRYYKGTEIALRQTTVL
jgi:sulfatase maturation enzyme AslB (radical SAM superfamily)